MTLLNGSPKLISVMLVDDDEDDQKIFTDAITEANANVQLQIAKNGVELMKTLTEAATKPDIVFLDINMPLKNGVQCLEDIHSDSRLNNIPIVIYSTSSYKPNIEESFQKGASLYFMKPNSFTQLVHDLRRILSIDWKEFEREKSFEKFMYS